MKISKAYDEHEARKLGFYADEYEGEYQEPAPSHLMNLYMSYDHSGFEEAKRLSDPDGFEPHHYRHHLFQMMSHGMYDMNKGFCSSFQIYSDKGHLILSYHRNPIDEAA
jgi:hypothetical protein